MKAFIISASCALTMSLQACGQPAPDTAPSAAAASESITIQAPAATISQADFISASEQTVNGVVSVKSYATPQQQSYGRGRGQGYADPFSDPFLEFFFGGPGRQRVPEQPQQQSSESRTCILW